MTKKHLYQRYLAAAVLGGIAGCAVPQQEKIAKPYQPSPVQETRELRVFYETKQLSQGKHLQLETIVQGTECNHPERKEYVITSILPWVNLWDKMHMHEFSPPDAPQIDFRKNLVVAVFQGAKETTGYTITITNIIETENTYDVFVTEKNPRPKEFIAKKIIQPHHLVTIPHSEKQIQMFYHTEK